MANIGVRVHDCNTGDNMLEFFQPDTPNHPDVATFLLAHGSTLAAEATGFDRYVRTGHLGGAVEELASLVVRSAHPKDMVIIIDDRDQHPGGVDITPHIY